jgi:hypothetical protein
MGGTGTIENPWKGKSLAARSVDSRSVLPDLLRAHSSDFNPLKLQDRKARDPF